MLYELMITCFVAGGIFLLIASLIFEFLLKRLKLIAAFPPELLEPYGAPWFVIQLIMDFLFFVAIPTFVFEFFNVLLPLTAVRTAMAATLLAFVVGAAPAILALTIRIKLPMPYLLFYLLAFLVKLGGSMAIVGYIYSL